MPSITDSIGRVLGDRYRLVAALGTGASAHVYLADDVSLHRRVAIKVLHPALAGDAAFLERFRSEARAVAALSHPNILHVYDWGDDDGAPYLVLEFLAGGSLRQVFDTGVRLTPAQAVQVGIQATAGLEYAHRRGLVHRDIKPANILFDGDGRLRIADFGLARALAEAAWTEPDGAILGTARYAAPEQVEGSALDGKADVYGLAIVLYEGVCGRAPFEGETAVATLMARVGALLPANPVLGPLGDVLAWAAAPQRAERYDAAAFAARLRSLATALPDPEPLALVDASQPADLDPHPLVQSDRSPARVAPAGEATVLGPAADATELGPMADATEIGLPGLAGVAVSPLSVARSPSSVRPEESPPPASRVQRRRRWPWVVGAVLLAALVAAGATVAVREKLFTPSHPVPSLVGRTVLAADRAVAADHFTVRQGGASYSLTLPAGRILGQQPPAKTGNRITVAKQGSVITVEVSKGLPPVTIPSDLTTYSDCAGAIKALAAVHLVGVCPASAAQYSARVPAGGVLGSAPTGSATYGSTVTIISSKGHAPVAIPAVSGSGTTYAGAAATLSAAGFVPIRHDRYSSTIPAGEVIGTSPDVASGPAPFGSTVTVDVSRGPRPVLIPQLIGRSVAFATRTLQGLGLRVATYGPFGAGVVVYTSPPSGNSVLPGTTVSLDAI